MLAKQSSAITMQVMGGLGNQMFIAAFGYIVSQRRGLPLRFDISFFEGSPPERQFVLSQFPALQSVPAGRGSFTGVRRYSDRVAGALGITPPGLFVEHGRLGRRFGFDEHSQHAKSASRFRGYFQSWRYFEGQEQQVRALFSRDNDSGLDERIRTSVGQHYIGMHVRRGDYLSSHSTSTFGLCSEDYYLRSLSIVRREQGGGLPLVVFSDSVEALPVALAEQAALVVGPDTNRPVVEDLFALARSTALVMSNSSFSWWAAFLHDEPGRTVLAPRPWFRLGDYAGSDLLLPGWASTGA